MAKIEDLVAVVSLQNETSAVQTLNSNSQKIEDALNNTLSLDGSTPNAMEANLDVGLNRVINLGAPVNPNDAVRLIDLNVSTGSLTTEMVDAILAAVPAAQSAEASAAAAAQSAIDAANYLGAAVSADHWTNARTITLLGDVSGSQSFDGSANFSVTATIAAGSVSASKLASGVALSNLGYTPLNKAGDTVTGDLIYSGTPASLNQFSIGFRGIPVGTHDSNYTFVLGDSAFMARHTSATAHAWTIPPNSDVAYPIGTALVGRVVGTGGVLLTRGSGVTIRLVGSATSQDVICDQWGFFTALQEAADTWVVIGSGLT